MAKFNCNFISYTLKRAVDLTIIIPSVTIPESLMSDKQKPTHCKKEKYPVLYLLHGYGNNHATWCGYSNIELYAEERQIAVVMLSAENKAYSNHGKEDQYFDFVSHELPEFVENMFPISLKKEETYIAGLSMGGYGALIHGLTCPERFKAIGSFSGAVEGMDPSMIKPRELMNTLLKENKMIPDLYIACGTDDFLYQSNLDFLEFLKENKVKVTSDLVEGYTHEWRFWDKEVELFLDWIERNDIYSKAVRKV